MDWLINLFRRWPRPKPPAPSPNPQPFTSDQAALILDHNQERAKAGVGSLTMNGRLNAAAQQHADDMARTGRLDHTGSDGSQPWDRASRVGYKWRAIGENIAFGQNSVSEVMNSWMNSPGHRDNILNGNYRDVGFGITRDGNGRLYWCALFGG